MNALGSQEVVAPWALLRLSRLRLARAEFGGLERSKAIWAVMSDEIHQKKAQTADIQAQFHSLIILFNNRICTRYPIRSSQVGMLISWNVTASFCSWNWLTAIPSTFPKISHRDRLSITPMSSLVSHLSGSNISPCQSSARSSIHRHEGTTRLHHFRSEQSPQLISKEPKHVYSIILAALSLMNVRPLERLHNLCIPMTYRSLVESTIESLVIVELVITFSPFRATGSLKPTRHHVT